MGERVIIKTNDDICNINEFLIEYTKNKFSIDEFIIHNNIIIMSKNLLKQASKTFADCIVRDYVFFLISFYTSKCDVGISEQENQWIYKKVIEDIYIKMSLIMYKKFLFFINEFSQINISGILRFAVREFDEEIIDLADKYVDAILF